MKIFKILFLNLFISLSSFSQVIDYIEYFFDSDPGLGQATPIEFTSYTQVDQSFNADISGLDLGIHRLFVRAKDSVGKWSILSSRIFNLTETVEKVSASKIVYVEYFIDTDPGLGNGIPVDISADSDLTIQINNNLTSLSYGIHRLFARAKDDNNNWSILGSRLFNIQTEPAQLSSTVKSIKWTVSGNGITPFSETKIISVPLSDLTENISPDISGLTNGDYTLSVSAIDNNGVSSFPLNSNFGVIAPNENKKSAQFDGTGDRIRVTDSAPLNGNANPSAYKISGNAISAEAWVFVASLPGSGKGEVILGRSASGAFGVDPYFSYALKLDNYSNGNPAFNFTISNGNAGSGLYAVADAVPVENGKWYHIAGTYDGSALKIYINGELKNQITSNSLSIGTGGVGFYIGGTTAEYFTGLIDDVRLWNVTRSGSEISDNMNSTLFGNESGLAGYWPMDSTYSNGTNTITPDMTENHNDLAVQFDAKLVNFPEGSEVQISPTNISFRLDGISGLPYRSTVTSDGWPKSIYTLVSGPDGMTLDGDTLKWEIPSSSINTQTVEITANNGGSDLTQSKYLFTENLKTFKNSLDITVTTRGKLGAYVSDSRYTNYGLFYNGKNGLFSGDFSLVDKNDSKYAGGLFSAQKSFRTLTQFESVSGKLNGFLAYQSSMDDAWESDGRINVKVLQTVYTKTEEPDNKYSIIEYKIINTSGAEIDSLYPQLTADFDIGNSANNLGGYDADLKMSYGYEGAEPQNTNYYGFSLLNQQVSGAAVIPIGQDPNYFRSTANLSTFTGNSVSAGDIRNQISSGPFTIAADETLTVAFAVLAGDNLDDLKQSAEQAKQNYNHSENKNSGAGYFVFTGDRARVNSGAKINPNANDAVLGDFTSNGITVEAWVFPTSLPSPKSEQIIVARPIIAGNPFQTYSLRFANYNQQNYPTLEFIISDGVTPDHWGYAGLTVDNSYIGKWIHVTGTYDGNTVRLFVDGVLKGSNSFDKQIGTNGQGIYIGGGTINGWGRSVIDEVRLWNYAKSGNEISSSMNYTLNGNEPGLVGYWPLDSYSTVQQNGVDISITPDLTENHNDLQMMGFSRIVDDVAGNDVKISPSHLRLTDNYVITGYKYKQGLILDGWPKPEVNLTNPIGNMAINSDSLTWNPNDSFWGEFYLKSTLINSEGQGNDSTFMYVSLAKNADENTQSLLFSTQGRFSAGGRYGQGLIYNGKNGLFDGAFGVVVKSENVVSGGLNSQAEFTDKLGIQTVTPKISGFDLAYELKYSDQGSRNSKPVGLEITQTVLQKKSAPDDHFTIVEFSIKNKSGKNLQNVFSELAADFDIGDPLNNLGGFIPENNLSYAFEVGGANNSAYYGISLLDEDVSGHTNSLSGFAYNDSEGLLAADSMFAEPTVPKDIRNALFAGPFNLENGDSVVVAYAFVAANNLNELKIAAQAAKTAYQPISVSVAGSRELPKEFSVSQNYPNPFNPSTKISYSVPRSADIQISIYDLMGREIAVLENSRKEVGTYSTIWNSINISGQTVSSGIYFYRIVAKTEKGVEFVKTNKMLLVK